jgi:thiol-disulfide isomerase/thioredoxin
MRKRALPWILPALLLLAGCGGDEGKTPKEGGAAPTKPAAEKPAVEEPATPAVEPKVETKDLDGLLDIVEAERDRPLVVHLWAAWCPQCMPEFPVLEALRKHLGARADLISVSLDFADNQKGHPSIDSAVEVVRGVAKQHHLAFPVYVVEGEGAGYYEYFETPHEVPYTVVYGKDGTRLGDHAEFKSADEAKAWIDGLLK